MVGSIKPNLETIIKVSFQFSKFSDLSLIFQSFYTLVQSFHSKKNITFNVCRSALRESP